MSLSALFRFIGHKLTDLSARRQLAFDMWWLALALWLVCIIEVSYS